MKNRDNSIHAVLLSEYGRILYTEQLIQPPSESVGDLAISVIRRYNANQSAKVEFENFTFDPKTGLLAISVRNQMKGIS